MPTNESGDFEGMLSLMRKGEEELWLKPWLF
jgi:hypothetical protein